MAASTSFFKRHGGSLNISLHRPKIVFHLFFSSPQTFVQGHIGHFLDSFMETLHQKAPHFHKNYQQAAGSKYASVCKSFLKKYRKSQWPVALEESLGCTVPTKKTKSTTELNFIFFAVKIGLEDTSNVVCYSNIPVSFLVGPSYNSRWREMQVQRGMLLHGRGRPELASDTHSCAFIIRLITSLCCKWPILPFCLLSEFSSKALQLPSAVFSFVFPTQDVKVLFKGYLPWCSYDRHWQKLKGNLWQWLLFV